jgi:hypothetical protein
VVGALGNVCEALGEGRAGSRVGVGKVGEAQGISGDDMGEV